MYKAGEAPFDDSGPSYGRWDLTFSLADNISVETVKELTDVLGEISLLTHQQVVDVGLDVGLFDEPQWCCTQKLFDEGKCTDLHKLIKNETLEYFAFDVDEYDSEKNSETLLVNHSVEQTAVYYLMMSNCRTDIPIMITGVIEWKNPYGYLPGDIYGLYFSYWVFFVCYLVLGIWYAVALYRNREEMMGLQKYVMAYIWVAFVETLIWGCDYDVYNKEGHIVDAVNVFGAFFTASRNTAIRLIVLMVCIGYSITKPTLRKLELVGIIIVSVCYFIADATVQYVSVASAAGAFIDENLQIFVETILIIANAIFFTWIALALLFQMRALKSLNQKHKWKLYKRFALLLVIAMVVAFIAYVAEFGITIAEKKDALFQLWWLWQVVWDIIYLHSCVAIALIWRPQPNMMRYAFGQEIGGGDGEVALDDAQSLDEAPSSSSEAKDAGNDGDDHSSSSDPIKDSASSSDSA
eukprot:TRINITY_DN611_c0_g1_i2.p1 TRINITY_DN611_c0_g1~~TRINITY_DN611_c0_g1_i2.p1  ORF type:complete len:529 (-),score=145.60 TRINITY_DN611_c0_g1_i2:113-1507(-)